jgi:hypothetical protein
MVLITKKEIEKNAPREIQQLVVTFSLLCSQKKPTNKS